MPVKLPPEAAKVAAEINKEYGDGTVSLASEIITPDKITTGSLAYDVALGGGLAVNQWHEFVGVESAGKTTVCQQAIAANQALDPEFLTVWVAAEWYDTAFAAMNGVDNDRVIVVNENSTERAFNVILKWLASKSVDAVVLDSLPAMTPDAEAEAQMEDALVALQARLTNRFFRKTGSSGKRAMNNTERPCTGFLINQWRDKIGIQWGDPRTTPGGNGKNYSFWTRTEVKRDEWIVQTKSGVVKTAGDRDSGSVRVGQTIKCRVFKNKSAPPHRVATFDYYFEDADVHPAGSIDTFKEIVGLGVVYDLIRVPSGHNEKSSWLEYGGVQANGAANMVEALAQDLDVAEVLRKEVLAVATQKKPHDMPPEIDPEEGLTKSVEEGEGGVTVKNVTTRRTPQRPAAKKTVAKKTTTARKQ